MDTDSVALGVDVGGTFTDVVLVADGDVTTAKVPTTSAQQEGVLAGIERACTDAGIEAPDVEQFHHAMTVATNALLEGTTADTALVTTAGFGDVLEIGRQDRPALYDLAARKPDPIVPAERRYEVDERVRTDGIETEVSDAAIEQLVEDIDDDIESVAICLLHAYANPANERRIKDGLGDVLDATLVASHETLPEFREYERTSTTVVDAAITPVIDAYLDELVTDATDRGLPAPRVMQSNGGIAPASALRDHAVTTVLSGPAAGVVGASLFGRDAHDGLITFDMGGTSSDVGLVRDGDIERTTTASIAGYPVHVPMVDVETVGAGGGSIAWVDEGGALRVGPRSAGADPGPACYGRGGSEPTVTDAAVVLGYLGADTTLGGSLSVDEDAAREALDALAAEADLDGALAAAHGVHRVANATMTRAIRRVTLERGHDPRSFGLVAFGGAGPMHACALADRLGVESIAVPKANGVLSAFGLLVADEQADASRTIRTPLSDADPERLAARFEQLADTVRDTVSDPAAAQLTRAIDCRYQGQSYELTVPVDLDRPLSHVADRFHDRHERERGFRLPAEPIELVTVRVRATIPGSPPTISHEGSVDEPRTTREAWFGDRFHETPVFDRDTLSVDLITTGPAIFEGGESTVVVPPGWTIDVTDRGTLVLEVTA